MPLSYYCVPLSSMVGAIMLPNQLNLYSPSKSILWPCNLLRISRLDSTNRLHINQKVGARYFYAVRYPSALTPSLSFAKIRSCASSLLETHSERCRRAGYGRYPPTRRLLHQRSGRAAGGVFAGSDEPLPLKSSTQPPPIGISGGPVVTVVQASKPRTCDHPTRRQRRTAASGGAFA